MSIICNMCGKPLSVLDVQERLGIHTIRSYGSIYDENEMCLDFCSNCMDNLVKKCKISPILSRNQPILSENKSFFGKNKPKNANETALSSAADVVENFFNNMRESFPEMEINFDLPVGINSCKLKDANIYVDGYGSVVIDAE